VTSSGFGATDGQFLVARGISGLSSPTAGNGSDPSSPGPVLVCYGPKSSVQAFGLDAYVVMGFVTSSSTSSVAAFGLVPTSSGPVMESSGPKSSVQASIPFD
jgi:hypothetical protein